MGTHSKIKIYVPSYGNMNKSYDIQFHISLYINKFFESNIKSLIWIIGVGFVYEVVF